MLSGTSKPEMVSGPSESKPTLSIVGFRLLRHNSLRNFSFASRMERSKKNALIPEAEILVAQRVSEVRLHVLERDPGRDERDYDRAPGGI